MKQYKVIGLLALFLATSATPILGMDRKGKSEERIEDYTQDLSPELLTAIFEYLDFYSCIAATQACKYWHDIFIPEPMQNMIRQRYEEKELKQAIFKAWRTLTQHGRACDIARTHGANALSPRNRRTTADAILTMPALPLPTARRRLFTPVTTPETQELRTILDPERPTSSEAPSSSTASLSPRSLTTPSLSPRLLTPSPRDNQTGPLSPIPKHLRKAESDVGQTSPNRNQAGPAPRPLSPMNPTNQLRPPTPSTTVDYDGDYSNSANAGNADYSSDSE